MMMTNNEPLRNVVILGDSENAILTALLIAHQLRAISVKVVLVVGRVLSPEGDLSHLSPDVRRLHRLLELSEKNMLSKGFLRYVYGVDFIKKFQGDLESKGSRSSFLSYERFLPNGQESDLALLAHAFACESSLHLDPVSLSCAAHKEGKFIDPDLIFDRPFRNLRAGVVVNLNEYKKFLLGIFKERGGSVEIAESVSVMSDDEISISFEQSKTVLNLDLMIDFSTDSFDVSRGGLSTVEQGQKRFLSDIPDLYFSRESSDSAQLPQALLCECNNSAQALTRILGGVSQRTIFSDRLEFFERSDHSCRFESVDLFQGIASKLFAPYWQGNMIVFPKSCITPWDALMTSSDWMRHYLVNIVDLWPRGNSIKACAMEFNRMGLELAADYFEMAAVYCRLNNINAQFFGDTDARAIHRLDLFKFNGVISESQSDLLSKSFWLNLMLIYGVIPSSPAGIYSKRDIDQFINHMRRLQIYNSAVVSKMPQYSEFINYLTLR